MSEDRGRGQVNKRVAAALICLALLCPVLIFVSICTGSTGIRAGDVIAILAGNGEDPTAASIILQIRFPRAAAAMILGGALGLSGYLLQTFFRNPIAGPFVLGISSGARLFVAALLIFYAMRSGVPGSLPMISAAFAGALLVVMLILAAARSCRFSPLRLILAGVALGALFSTISTVMLVMAPERYSSVFNFLLGGFSGISVAELKIFAPGLFISIILPLFMGRKLDILSLGDDCAATLGIPVPVTRLTALMLAALGAASSAGCAGMLSFAGLIAPHTVRLLGRSGSNRFVLPASAAAGAILVVTGDFLGQIMAPESMEIPAGVFLSGCGALFFILLLTASGRDEL